MNEENSKIYYPCHIQNMEIYEMKQEKSQTENRHLKILRNRQLIALDLTYGIDLKYRSKYELFLHLVNTLNRNSMFPFLIKTTNQNDMPISITYRYTYLLEQQNPLLNYHPEQDNTDQEGKNKKVDFNQLWKWTDTLQITILNMVHKSIIKESVYPKQYQLIEQLEKESSQVEGKFYSLAQQLIKQTVSQQNSEEFEKQFTFTNNFLNFK